MTQIRGFDSSFSETQHIHDIKDREHSYSLEQLKVVSEGLIDANDGGGEVL